MEIVLGILFNIVFLCSLFIIGRGFCSLLAFLPKSGVLAYGFIAWFGLAELLSFSIMAGHGYRSMFFVLNLVLYLALMALGLREGNLNKLEILNSFKKYWQPKLFTIILIVLCLVFVRSDADDSFYVSLSALFTKSNILNPYDPSFGIDGLGTVPMYDFGIWECFLGMLSMLFGVAPVSLMHSFALPILLSISASAFLALGEVLFSDENKAKTFYFFVCILHLFGGYSVFSQGSFLLSRLWQGKAVYLTCLIPVLVVFILLAEETRPMVLVCMGFLIILSGIGLNPTSLYVMGFLSVFLTIATCIAKKNPNSCYVLFPIILVVARFTYLIYDKSRQFPGQIEASSQADYRFVIDTFLSFFGNGRGLFYLLLLLLAIVFTFFKGSINAKIYICLLPVLLCAFLYNPYLGSIIAAKITKTPSYWRVFWILPMIPGVAYAATLALGYVKKESLRVVCAITLAIIVSIPGEFMFTRKNGFSLAQNIEKLPPDTLSFGEVIEDGSVLLCADDLSTTIRQKYPDIELIYSRYQYLLDLFYYRGKEKESTDRLSLYGLTVDTLEDYSELDSLLKLYNVNYIALPKSNERAKKAIYDRGYLLVKEGEDNLLFKR